LYDADAGDLPRKRPKAESELGKPRTSSNISFVPEIPDVTVYVERLQAHVGGKRLERVRIASPFVVRSYDPPIREAEGKRVLELLRIGKRIVLGLEGDLFLVIHLMISGRLRWRPSGAAVPKKVGLAAFDFESGTLVFTEASSKKRASLHLVRGRPALGQFERGGIEPLTASLSEFRAALLRENRTLKRALTDPRLISGIGNAYSDEILFAAGLSPVKRTHQLGDEEIEKLWAKTRTTLEHWIEKTRAEVGDGFPETVTAFRDGMAVHGRYKQPCPVCETPVQRIRYAENEVNYCPRCQTGGKLLADRALSRLLGADWPRSIEELDERLGKGD
jgi:formamidopyrimidine-DNA glycosylase